jgi:hypothetical protein
MINKDFESFKKSHPTLLKAIMNAMEDACDQAYDKGRSDQEKIIIDFIRTGTEKRIPTWGQILSDKLKPYTIDDIERAVNHWSMTTVEKENIIKFLEK